MNKFAILLCFLLIFNCTHAAEKFEEYYDYVFNVLKGMSREGEGLCAKVFEENKEKILDILTRLFKEIKDGKSVTSIILGYGLELASVDGFLTNCNAIDLFQSVQKFMSISGIRAIGETVRDNSESIYNIIDKIKHTKGINSKLENLGEFVSTLLQVNVN